MPKGGKRTGAGRKAGDIEYRRVTISLPVELLAQIDKRAYSGSNRSAVIAQLLQKALDQDN